MPHVEIFAGILAAGLIFLAARGIDLTPLFMLAGIAAILYVSAGRLSGRKSFFPADSRTIPVSFDDIGGQDTAKQELREALTFLQKRREIQSLGIRPLKGVLLNGPPGTGKTLLAKAAAHFTDSVFLAASGSEFVEMYVGVGAQRVRQLFDQARRLAKQSRKSGAVIFIDEMEVLGGARGQNSHTEHDQTLNELLIQMDGIGTVDSPQILVIGATNRVDMLDPALLRPGRFDRQVNVELPDKQGRLRILELHTRNKPLAKDVVLAEIANDTFGFSGAHLENVANEAAIFAMREQAGFISQQHFRNAIEKVIMGEKLDRLPSPEEKNRIAVHEAGHALASEILHPGSVASVNVASRSHALGYVRHTQEDDMYLYTAGYLRNRIAVALAGSAAEDLVLDSRSTGGSNDFKQAAELARQIVQGGMSGLGIISVETLPPEKLHSATAAILQEADAAARTLLTARRDILNRIAAVLLSRETLSGEELRRILTAAQ